MSVQERAVQMIHSLSDDNVRYLIDFMQRFMMPKEVQKNIAPINQEQKADKMNFMQEMEDMRLKAKSYFPSEFDAFSPLKSNFALQREDEFASPNLYHAALEK